MLSQPCFNYPFAATSVIGRASACFGHINVTFVGSAGIVGTANAGYTTSRSTFIAIAGIGAFAFEFVVVAATGAAAAGLFGAGSLFITMESLISCFGIGFGAKPDQLTCPGAAFLFPCLFAFVIGL